MAVISRFGRSKERLLRVGKWQSSIREQQLLRGGKWQLITTEISSIPLFLKVGKWQV